MIRTEKTHLKTTAGTHAGMSGKNNEDSYGVSAYILDDESSTPVLFAVLADGIGGHNAGEVASALVVDTVSQKISQSNASDPLAILKDAIQTASRQVQKIAKENEGRKGMGSTVVCAWIIGKQLYTGYVGDSRIYLVRDNRITRLTLDHSWIQEALDSGLLTPEQAAGHPNSHVIRRYVGSPEPPEVDFRLRLNPDETPQQSVANQGLVLKNGDRLLLCSDGLTDLVNDDEILSLISENSAEEAIDKMIDLANQRGGHDNITTVIIQVPEGVFVEGKPQTGNGSGKTEPQKKTALPVRLLTLGCLGILAALILIVGGYFGIRLLTEHKTTSTPSPSVAITELQGIIQESQPVELTLTPAALNTPVTGSIQTGTSSAGTLSAPENAGTTQGGGIVPPPNPAEMTAFPTNTLAAAATATHSAVPNTATPTTP